MIVEGCIYSKEDERNEKRPGSVVTLFYLGVILRPRITSRVLHWDLKGNFRTP